MLNTFPDGLQKKINFLKTITSTRSGLFSYTEIAYFMPVRKIIDRVEMLHLRREKKTLPNEFRYSAEN